MTITAQKSEVAAVNQRCTILYASTDPTLNLATSRARQMSPDELYNAGFRAGFDNKGMRASLADYPDYIEGWRKGYRDRF